MAMLNMKGTGLFEISLSVFQFEQNATQLLINLDKDLIAES